jgi:hypothetical protein
MKNLSNKDYIESIRATSKRILEDKVTSIRFLVEAGINQENGELTSHYVFEEDSKIGYLNTQK